jgi:predicted nucleic acid-binding protein
VSALLDTSVLIGPPSPEIPAECAISVVSLAELRLGVLTADSASTRSLRLTRLMAVEREFEALPVDDDVASAYATIVAAERERGRKVRAMDALIAATALAKGLTLLTRDRDLARIEDLSVETLR